MRCVKKMRKWMIIILMGLMMINIANALTPEEEYLIEQGIFTLEEIIEMNEIKEPNWVSPPNCVDNGTSCIAYIIHNITQPKNGYWVENFYGDNYFFDDYTIAKDHKTNNVLIEDVRWEIEYFQNKWRTLDLWDKSIIINSSDPKELLVKRISTDGTSTLTETYHYTKGTPKIDLNFTTTITETYRLVWQSTGIAGTKTKEEILLSNDFSFNDKHNIVFTDELEERFLVSLGWGDAFNSSTNETTFIKADWWSSNKKLDVYFGNFTGGFYIDPTWTTPSAVISFSSEASFYKAVDSIDDDISGGFFDTWDEGTEVDGGTYDWYIIYDMGSSECIGGIQIYTDGNAAQAPCKVGSIKVCDDSACSGESNLIASECMLSTNLEWQICELDTDTEGRYIEVRGGIYFGIKCETKISPYEMDDFHEFDADIDGSCVPVDDTDPVATSLSPVNTANLTSTTVDFGLKCTDETGLTNAAVYGNFTGSWLVNASNSSIINDTVWNVSITVPDDGGYMWAAWCNDTSGNTDFFDVNWTFTVTTAVEDTCTYVSGNWAINASHHCNLSITNLLTNNVTIIGSSPDECCTRGLRNLTNYTYLTLQNAYVYN